MLVEGGVMGWVAVELHKPNQRRGSVKCLQALGVSRVVKYNCCLQHVTSSLQHVTSAARVRYQ